VRPVQADDAASENRATVRIAVAVSVTGGTVVCPLVEPGLAGTTMEDLMLRRLLTLSIILLASASARADLVTLESVAHGTLYQTKGDQLANGLGQHLFAGNNGQNLTRRGLIRFDPDGLGDVVVESAVLRLHVSQANEAPSVVSLHRVLSAWGVGSTDAPGGEGGGGPATPGSATWTQAFFGKVPWTTPGGDFDALALAATQVGGVGWYEWSGDDLTAAVQAMIDEPGSNVGWLLRGDESMASTAKRFDSMFAAAEFRPELVVTYSAVPTPGALALLGIAGGLGRGRRRR